MRSVVAKFNFARRASQKFRSGLTNPGENRRVITTLTPAIDKSVRILDYLANNPRSTFKQIQQFTGLPKSTTSSLLASLVSHSLLRVENAQYSLGLRWYEYGSKVDDELDIKKLALKPLTALRDQTHLTCHLGLMEGNAAIYVLKLESPTAIIIRSWVGRRLTLHRSGLGKALLAWLSPVELEAIIPDIDFEVVTRNSISDAAGLRQELELTRTRGWAFDNAEDNEGVYCIAAPIFGRDGNTIAAISTSGVSSQINDSNIKEFAQLVKNTAGLISAEYGQLSN